LNTTTNHCNDHHPTGEQLSAADTNPSPVITPPAVTAPRYQSFGDLPRLTHICGGVIVVLGLANLILTLVNVEQHGLLWLFFYSIPANTAISVFPHEPAIVFCGQHFAPLIVALVATAGNLAAGWVDYHFFTPLLQMKFSTGYKKSKTYLWAIRWFNIAPFWVVVLFALTPLPFYLVKFLAFSSGYSMAKYMTAIAVGRLPRFYLLAMAGYFLKIPVWIMVVLFSVIFAVYLVWIVRTWVKTRAAGRAAK
jgi:membrane protein YqaA with SNARE-associated domain